jgi:hypothetical protein
MNAGLDHDLPMSAAVLATGADLEFAGEPIGEFIPWGFELGCRATT